MNSFTSKVASNFLHAHDLVASCAGASYGESIFRIQGTWILHKDSGRGHQVIPVANPVTIPITSGRIPDTPGCCNLV